ncbi:hypothetical protein VITFI_CDS3013 [Vitreoscilla filiformis]|uniref:Uncharacterized protein n=1 Tax=Vitreoscilla filiformis TaxID=63 RepID=A0A221KJ12_VITFI|nr:hypothetical protein VITFI_CDS3013 [Vitreoscilla filiformis]
MGLAGDGWPAGPTRRSQRVTEVASGVDAGGKFTAGERHQCRQGQSPLYRTLRSISILNPI